MRRKISLNNRYVRTTVPTELYKSIQEFRNKYMKTTGKFITNSQAGIMIAPKIKSLKLPKQKNLVRRKKKNVV